MKRDHIANEAASKELTAPKRGYSIWSLLVIMTLLAVWMAIPRTVSLGKWPESVLVFFIVFHQLTLWSLVGSVNLVGYRQTACCDVHARWDNCSRLGASRARDSRTMPVQFRIRCGLDSSYRLGRCA